MIEKSYRMGVFLGEDGGVFMVEFVKVSKQADEGLGVIGCVVGVET